MSLLQIYDRYNVLKNNPTKKINNNNKKDNIKKQKTNKQSKLA
jgi:hypothetical protein